MVGNRLSDRKKTTSNYLKIEMYQKDMERPKTTKSYKIISILISHSNYLSQGSSRCYLISTHHLILTLQTNLHSQFRGGDCSSQIIFFFAFKLNICDLILCLQCRNKTGQQLSIKHTPNKRIIITLIQSKNIHIYQYLLVIQYISMITTRR